MVRLLYLILISYLILNSDANFTKISRNNGLLSRKKRFLVFPMGSNLVMTMSAVKAFMQVQPRGWNFLFEVDVPFALPSDTRFFKKKKNKERRSIYSRLNTAFTENGLNGTACVRTMICEAQQFIPQKGKSLVKDMLLAIFSYESSEFDFDQNYVDCEHIDWMECNISFLDYILNSFTKPDNELYR